MPHLIVFGNSIVAGYYDQQGGWVQRLRQSLEVKRFTVYNLAVSGETTQTLVERFEIELIPRLSQVEPNSILISLGLNDSAYNYQIKHCWVSLPRFKQNLTQLIKLARKYTQKIIFVGPAPVDQPKVDPIPWHPDLSYKNSLIKKYSEAIKLICQKEKLFFIDLFNRLRSDYINCLDDGVHPNHQGHQKIYKIVVKNIKMC